jgi:hypothetical protein
MESIAFEAILEGYLFGCPPQPDAQPKLRLINTCNFAMHPFPMKGVCLTYD